MSSIEENVEKLQRDNQRETQKIEQWYTKEVNKLKMQRPNIGDKMYNLRLDQLTNEYDEKINGLGGTNTKLMTGVNTAHLVHEKTHKR